MSFVKRNGSLLQTLLRTLWAGYNCPVCDTRVSAFEPLPKFYVENLQKHGFPFGPDESETCNYEAYSCPSCGASDRDRLCALFLRDYLANLEGHERIIDFAPSPSLSGFIRKQLDRVELPISYRTADFSGVGVDDKVDITDLQTYDDSQFEFIICSHVLEHVTDDRKALKELYRILSPGGKGIIMVPIVLSLTQTDEDPTITDESERWRRFGQDDHVRIYSKADFIKRVEQSGFRVHQYDKTFFGEDTLRRAGITNQSVLYVIEK